MLQSEERCLNCNQHLLLQQKFCHQCGQKTNIHRINFRYFVHEVPHSIFHVDGGIIFTLRELFTRPGHTIREYLEGKRQPHFKPVMLVLIMGSLCALLQLLLNKTTSNEKNDSVIRSNLSQSPLGKYVDFKGLIAYFQGIFHWLTSHFAFTVLLMLPITAFAFYLGFRKYKLNYPEWLVVFLFFAGQSLTVYVFFIFLNRFAGDYTMLFFFVIWALITFSLIQFFREHGKMHVVLRTLWSVFLSYFLTFIYVVFAIILMLIIGIMIYGKENMIPVIHQ